jgi:osmotically-inducible protein OsmY
MPGRSDKTPSSYDEILRRTVVNTDTSMRPSREEELLARHRFGEATEHRPRPLTRVELDLLNRVRQALMLDPRLDLTNVDVAVDGRCVVLTGDVPGVATSVRIADLAAALPGVDGVDNQLVVRSHE